MLSPHPAAGLPCSLPAHLHASELLPAGGTLGDRLGRRLPNSPQGRVLVNQLSVLIGMPMSFLVLKGEELWYSGGKMGMASMPAAAAMGEYHDPLARLTACLPFIMPGASMPLPT